MKKNFFAERYTMGRKEDRAAKALEKNPIKACNMVQRRFCPDLFNRFGQTVDPRHQGYITYTNRIMLGQLYYKGIAGITSMKDKDMTDKFNNQQIIDNIAAFMGVDLDEYLPHHVTENEYLERLNPDELQKVIQDMVYQLIRRKSFDDVKFMKKWLIIIDGTQLYSGNRRINEKCLECHHNKGKSRKR
ncbi:MAG: transposase family protein [Lachnospiraceae bacterium]|nr:transposase family protein [Lachnospiraceae bacterium]